MCQWHTRKLRDYRYLDVDEVYQYPFEEGIASTRPLRVIEGASKNLVIVVDTHCMSEQVRFRLQFQVKV